MTFYLKRKFISSVILASLICLLSISLYHYKVFERNEWIAYDWLMKHKRENSKAPDDIVIILIDDASLQAMDPVVGRWPWPRSVMADVIDFLSLGAPKAILFDVLFSESQVSAGAAATNFDDKRLIESTAASQNTYHAIQFIKDTEDETNHSLLNKPLPDSLINQNAISFSVNETRTMAMNNYLVPMNGLHQAAKGLGVVSIYEDRDGVLRRTPLFHQYQQQLYPSLSITSIINKDDTIKITGNIDWQNIKTGIPYNIPYKNSLYLINPYKHFNTYSMSGVLSSIAMLKEGNIDSLLFDPSEIEGKTVFIGASAIGLNDLKTTSINDKTPGVTIHASVLGNILEQDFIKPSNPKYTIAWIILLAILTTAGVLYSKTIYAQIAIPFTLLLSFSGFSIWQFQQNQIIELIPPLLSILLAWALAYTYLLFTEEKEKNKIRKMFSQYVSPAALSVMVDQYEDYAGAGAGTKETVSMLFSDIRGFTTLSENINAETVVEILNYYLARMTNTIHNHHGTVDKFIGDAIMAIWGAPIRSSTHAYDSVLTALEMREKLKEVNQWLISRHLVPIDIGIGINTGEVILGSIGSEQKADYTVIGDNVNLASRLEGITKTYGCSIIIAESTYVEISDKIPCLLVDMVKVKGKSNPIKIYTPINEELETVMGSTQQAVITAEQSQQAFDHYMKQEWQNAIQLYEQLPHTNLRNLYLKRCMEYQAELPNPDWDGSYQMQSK